MHSKGNVIFVAGRKGFCMKFFCGRLLSVVISIALLFPTVPVFSATAPDYGNVFGNTSFKSDGTLDSTDSKIEFRATAESVNLDGESVIKLTSLTDKAVIFRKWLPLTQSVGQYMVSAKVRLVNDGETANVYFKHSNSGISSVINDDTNYNQFYNSKTDGKGAVAVDSDKWAEVYAIYSIIDISNGQSASGIHLNLVNNEKKDMYIKDFRVVETGTLDNLLAGPVDPGFDNSEAIFSNANVDPSYEHTGDAVVITESGSSNKCVKLTGFNDSPGAFRLGNLPFTAGKTYRVSMKAKLHEDAAAEHIASVDIDGIECSNFIQKEKPVLSGTEWKTCVSTFTVSESCKGNVDLRVSGMTDGALLADDLCVKEVAAETVVVTETVPKDTEIDVPITQKLKIKFSGTIEAFGFSNISVTGSDGVEITGITALKDNVYEISLTGLVYKTEYTVELKNIIGIANGQAFDGEFSFTTVDTTIPEPDNNLLSGLNYDFEEEIVSSDGKPDNCSLYINGTGVSAVSVQGTEELPAQKNSHYAFISNRNGASNGIRFNYAPATEVGGFYKASVWVRLDESASGNVSGYIGVNNFGQNTVEPSAVYGQHIPLSTNKWTEVSHLFRVNPKDGAQMPYVSRGMHIGLYTTSSNAAIHIDNFRLEKFVPAALQLTECSPENGSTGVALDETFTVTFNNPLKNLTIDQVSVDNGASVSAVTKISDNSYELKLDRLHYGTSYTVTITDIEDAYDGLLDSYMYTFTTCDRPEMINVLVNPGFENSEVGAWKFGGGTFESDKQISFENESSASEHWVITADESYSGNYSVCSTGTGDGCQLFYNAIPVQSNKDYVFSFYAKANSAQSVYVRQGSVSGLPAFDETKITLEENGQWTRYAVVFNTLENTKVRIFAGHAKGTSKENYYDDFVVAQYDSLMEITHSSIEDGATDVPININKITIETANRIDESERQSIIEKFSINNGANIASAEVIGDGSVVELTLDGNLECGTDYTLTCLPIADEFGIYSSESEIKFTTKPEFLVLQTPTLSGGIASARVENCTNSKIKAPVLIYAEYDENDEICFVKASDFNDEVPKFTEYTCTINGISALDTGHTAMLYLIRNESDMILLTEPVGTKPEFGQTDLYENRIDPQSGTVTVGGVADKNTDILVAVLKPLDATKNSANVTAYNPAAENKITVQSLLSSIHTAIDETNLQSYLCHLVDVATNEKGEYSVTLPLTKTTEKTVYGVIAADNGFDGAAAALYMPSTDSYNDATRAVDVGGTESNITNVLDNYAADLGISLVSPVYGIRKSNIISAMKSVYPQNGYTDYTTSVEGSFRNDFLKVLSYYERQEEALGKINSATQNGLTAVLTEYSEVLGEYNQSKLDFNAKYNKYGEVNINRQLVGYTYSSMNEFVEKFNKTVYTPPVENSDKTSFGGGGNGGKGASFEMSAAAIPQVQQPQPIFSDLTGYEWAEDAIIKLADRGVINGMGDGTFNPGGRVTREQFVKMLVLALGIEASDSECVFDDADNGSWYVPYINAAYRLDIVKGVSDTEFGVGSSITRQDMAVMIARACALLDKPLTKIQDISFQDGHTVSGYAADAVTALAEAGIINGVSDGTMAPFDSATRAQVAVILDRLG